MRTSNRPLFTRPEEIVFIIVSHVEERHDLLSLALTSQVFRRIIIPSFLDVIHIRCDPRRPDLWEWIISNPHLAARTRTLELVDEIDERGRIINKAIIPSSFVQAFGAVRTREFYEERVLLLAAAVVLMIRLRCFRWSGELPLAHAFESLFISLAQLKNMDEFNFRFLGGSMNYSFVVNDEDGFTLLSRSSVTPLMNIHDITTLCLNVVNFPWYPWFSDSDYFVQDWMMGLTNLKHLRLIFTCSHFDFVIICKRAHWPLLVELSLEEDVIVFPEFPRTDNDSIIDNALVEGQFEIFLRNHPTLERLRICNDNDYSGSFQPQTLPRLRSLILDGSINYAEPLGDWLPLDIAQKIKYLECSISERSLSTLGEMTSLRIFNAIDMDLEIFQRFVEVVPRIQQLRIPYREWYLRRKKTLEFYHFADTVISSLFKLKDLVQLEGEFIAVAKELSENRYLITSIMKHERLMYIDSFTREQVDLLLQQATLRVGEDFQLPRATVSGIKKSGDFFIMDLV